MNTTEAGKPLGLGCSEGLGAGAEARKTMDHKDHDLDSLLAAAQAQEKRQHSFYTAKEFGPVMHTLICEKHWTLADTCRWIIAQGFKYSAVNLRLGYELWLEKNPEKRADLPGYFRPLAKRQKARAPEAP